MDPEIVTQINNIYSLVAFTVLIISVIITALIRKNQQKKQTQELIRTQENNNARLIEKLDELKMANNELDLQSSMDIIHAVYSNSKYRIKEFILNVVEHNNFSDSKRQEEIKDKLNNLISMCYDGDVMLLSRIYYKHRPLSIFMDDLNKEKLHDNIIIKLLNGNYKDALECIDSAFGSFIQKDQLKLTE